MLSRVARLSALVLPVTFAGCQLNLPSFNAEGYRFYELSPGYFAFDVESSRLAALGGPGSQRIKDLIDTEVARRNLCPKGWRIRNDGGGKGYYYVNGQCTGIAP